MPDYNEVFAELVSPLERETTEDRTKIEGAVWVYIPERESFRMDVSYKAMGDNEYWFCRRFEVHTNNEEETWDLYLVSYEVDAHEVESNYRFQPLFESDVLFNALQYGLAHKDEFDKEPSA